MQTQEHHTQSAGDYLYTRVRYTSLPRAAIPTHKRDMMRFADRVVVCGISARGKKKCATRRDATGRVRQQIVMANMAMETSITTETGGLRVLNEDARTFRGNH